MRVLLMIEHVSGSMHACFLYWFTKNEGDPGEVPIYDTYVLA